MKDPKEAELDQTFAAICEGICPDCRRSLEPNDPVYVMIDGKEFDRTLAAGYCNTCHLTCMAFKRGVIVCFPFNSHNS